MKRTVLLSGMMVLLTIGFVTLNAQQITTSTAITDYSVLHVNTMPAEAAVYVDSITIGGGALSDSIEGGGNASNMVIPYFVMPFLALNGGYDLGAGAVDNTKLTSSWAWTFAAAPTSAAFVDADYTATLGVGMVTDTLNQIFVDWGTDVENVQVNVVETSNPTNCAGAVSYINVALIPVPTADITSANEQYCEDAGSSKQIVLNLTGVPPFQFRIDSVVQAVDPTTGNWVSVNAAANEIIITGASNGSTIGGGTLGDAGDADPTTWTFTFDAATFACDGGRITERLYRVTGINGRISRKSDRASEGPGTSIYYAADDDVTYTAYPTPTTGNIYNIDN